MSQTHLIKWITDKVGELFFPVTHIRAVRDDDGRTLENILSDKMDKEFMEGEYYAN